MASDSSGNATGSPRPEAAPAAGAGSGPKTAEDLAEVMRRRRQSCQEFESSPEPRVESSPSAAGSRDAAAPAPVASTEEPLAQAAPVAPRTASDLARVLQQRRSACAEFESKPGAHTADAGTASCARVDATATGAEVQPVTPRPAQPASPRLSQGSPGGGGELADLLQQRRSACKEYESAPGTSCADVRAAEAGPEARRPSAAGDLAEVLQQRRSACKEYESAPGMSSADARAAAGLEAGGSRLRGFVRSAGAAPAARSRTSDEDFHSWLEAMKGRCEVLESTPAATTADARNEQAAVRARRPPVARVVARKARGAVGQAAAAGAAEGAGPEAQEQPVEEAEEDLEEEVEEEEAAEDGLEEGEDEVVEAPAEAGRQAPEAEEAPSPSRPERLEEPKAPTPAIASAAEGTSPQAPLSQAEAVHAKLHNGEMLPHALRIQVWAERLRHSPGGGSTASSAPASSPLAGAVAAVHHLLAASSSLEGHSGSLATEDSYVAALAAAFVERHLHWLSEADANLAGGAEGGPAFAMLAQLLRYHYPAIAGSPDLASALAAACDGPAGLSRLLLSPVSEGDEMVLLLLCDLLVLEDLESLALFVIMALAMEAHQEGSNFEKVRLQGFGARGTAGVRRCVARACEFHEATPRSLAFALARGSGTSARPRLRLPICVVAPDEVIHHVYERPSGSWRFVVVDVRREVDSDIALPVGLRLNPQQDRRAILKGLAYEESIHLCFVGDGPPASGDEAVELCRFLAGSAGGRRPHVSVAEGGWPAVSGLVQSFGLEFMRVGAPKKDARSGQSSPKAPKGLQQAVASLAGVAEQVTSGATAAAVRHQVAKQAKQVRSQAGRAFFGFGSSRSAAAPTEPQRA